MVSTILTTANSTTINFDFILKTFNFIFKSHNWNQDTEANYQ